MNARHPADDDVLPNVTVNEHTYPPLGVYGQNEEADDWHYAGVYHTLTSAMRQAVTVVEHAGGYLRSKAERQDTDAIVFAYTRDTRMNEMERCIIQHKTSGETFVADVDGNGYLHGISYPLRSAEWQDDEGDVRPTLDLNYFELQTPVEQGLDAPVYEAGEWHYLACQEGANPIRIPA